MLVHTPTLFLVLAAISLIAAMAVGLEERRVPARALRLWTGAYLCAAALAVSSLVLFPLRPDWAVVIPTAFAMLALSLMYAGLAAHMGRPVGSPIFLPILFWLAVSLLRWHGAPLEETYVERRVVLCVLYLGYSLAILSLLLRKGRPNRASKALVAVFALYGAFYAVRLALLMPDGVPEEAALADFWITFSIYKTILVIAATAYLFIALHRERSERDLRHAAEIDSLTGMRNRRAFRARAELLLENDVACIVAVIDLDNFKVVNDTCGHAGGDEILRQFAVVLRSAVEEGDVCGRLGGEEFALLMRGESRSGAARRIEEMSTRFRRGAERTCELPFPATFSAGLAEAGAGSDLDEVLGRADAALYRAKRAGRDRLEFADVAAASPREPYGRVARS